MTAEQAFEQQQSEYQAAKRNRNGKVQGNTARAIRSRCVEALVSAGWEERTAWRETLPMSNFYR